MADLSITADDVSMIDILETDTLPAGEDITVGEYVRLDTSTGKAVLAAGDTASNAKRYGIATNTAKSGEAVHILRQGKIELGSVLSGASYNDPVYLSDNDGQLSLAVADSTQNFVVGHVVPFWKDASGPEKALHLAPQT